MQHNSSIQCGCDLEIATLLGPRLKSLAFVCIEDTVLQDKQLLSSMLRLKDRNTDTLIADEGTQSKSSLLIQCMTLVSIPTHLKLTSHMLFRRAQGGKKSGIWSCLCCVYAISAIKSELIPYILGLRFKQPVK